MRPTLFVLSTLIVVSCGHEYKNSKALISEFEKRGHQKSDTLFASHQECTGCLDLSIDEGTLTIPADLVQSHKLRAHHDILVCGQFPHDLIDPTSFNVEPGVKFRIVGKVIKADTNNGVGTIPLFYVESWEVVKHIPTETIIRRYSTGINNFFTLYKDIVNNWLFIDNSKTELELIAEGKENSDTIVYNNQKWQLIQRYADNETI